MIIALPIERRAMPSVSSRYFVGDLRRGRVLEQRNREPCSQVFKVLAFQKAAAAAYKEDRPSTIKQSLIEEELGFQMEILEESEADLLDVYDGMEELCGDIGSPEPGEVIDETDLSGTDDGMSDTIEEGEYIEDDSTASSPATPLSVEGVEQCDTSQAEALQEMDSSSD
ncbi:hypothetical protein OSTOST_12913, partial [Ostertagia ostertagi]